MKKFMLLPILAVLLLAMEQKKQACHLKCCGKWKIEAVRQIPEVDFEEQEISNGQMSLIEEKETDIKTAKYPGWTSVYAAARTGRLDVVKYLVEEKGDDFKTANKYGWTPVDAAAQNGRLDVVKYLVEYKKSDIQNVVKYFVQENTTSRKLLSKDLLQFFGDFLEPDSVQKMNKTSKQWSNVKIYENIFPNESEVAVLRNVNTEEILWKTIQFTDLWETMPKQEILVSHLLRNDSSKWNDVFLWFVKNMVTLKYKSRNKDIEMFLKALMLATAENVTVAITGLYSKTVISPLMIAAAFDEKDSILALIKRHANVNQQNNYGMTTLYFAAKYGNIDGCATLLENNANIDSVTHLRVRTPMMIAALFKKKDVYEFLIKKGADQTLTDINGKTASQLARFEQK